MITMPSPSPQATKTDRQQGFTLVELLVAMLVGAVVMGAVMTSFRGQHATYLSQDQVVEMQQNIRVAMTMLKADIRSAGYDPNGLGAAITEAEPDRLIFSRDDGSGFLEFIRYQLYNYSAGGTLIPALSRSSDADQNELTNRPLAENITRLEFVYLDAEGNPTSEADEIRTIQVSLLVQSAHPESGLIRPARPIYTTPGGDEWQADAGFLNRYLTTTILCRNLGL